MEYIRQGSRFSRSNILVALFAVGLLVGVALIPSGCSQSSNHITPVRGTPMVRVLILNNQTSVKLSATEQPMIPTRRRPRTAAGFVQRRIGAE